MDNSDKDGCSKIVQVFFTILGIIVGAAISAFVAYGITGSIGWMILASLAGAIVGGFVLWHVFDPDLQGIGY